MLAAPQFTERLAVHWLDLTRYADSNGYLEDSPRAAAAGDDATAAKSRQRLERLRGR